MSSQTGDLASRSRRPPPRRYQGELPHVSGIEVPRGSQDDPPRRNGKYEKRSESRKQFKKTIPKNVEQPDTSSTINQPIQQNIREQVTSVLQDMSRQDAANVPVWFKSYMDVFKRHIVAETTENIMKHLEASQDDDEARRRHKASYFGLKKRFNYLESQLAAERAENQKLRGRQNTPVRKERTSRDGDRKPSNQDDNRHESSSFTTELSNTTLSNINQQTSDDGIAGSSPQPESSSDDYDGSSMANIIYDTNNKSVEKKFIIHDVNDSKKVDDKKSESKPTFIEQVNEIFKYPLKRDDFPEIGKKFEKLGIIDDNNDVKKLVNKFFDQVKETPELSDNLSELISQITNQCPGNIKLNQVFSDVCNNHLNNLNYEKILFIGSLYEQNLIDNEILTNCMIKFIKLENEKDIECFGELLEIVGENLTFWKKSKCLEMIKKISEEDKIKDGKIMKLINRILHGYNMSLEE